MKIFSTYYNSKQSWYLKEWYEILLAHTVISIHFLIIMTLNISHYSYPKTVTNPCLVTAYNLHCINRSKGIIVSFWTFCVIHVKISSIYTYNIISSLQQRQLNSIILHYRDVAMDQYINQILQKHE